jgi:O-antigen/teichoic acid export membrane protein
MLAATVAGGLYTLISPISQAYYPRLCELRERQDEKDMIEAFHAGAQLISVIAGSAALVVLVFADTLLHLWTQDAAVVQAAGPLLSILALGNLLNALMSIPYQAQLAHGWTSLTVCINTVAVLFVIPAIFVVTPRYGATGAAWVWVGINIGYVLISIHFMFRKILQEEKWRWYFQDVLFPLVPAALTVLGLGKFLGVSKNSWIQLAILVVASFLTVSVAGVCANRVRTVAFQFLRTRLRIRTLPTL